MDRDKPHFLSKAAETSFCDLKAEALKFFKSMPSIKTLKPQLLVRTTFDPPEFLPDSPFKVLSSEF
jgi:hypothetical protein